MIQDFPIDIRIKLAELNFFLLLPDFANFLPSWLAQFCFRAPLVTMFKGLREIMKSDLKIALHWLAFPCTSFPIFFFFAMITLRLNVSYIESKKIFCRHKKFHNLKPYLSSQWSFIQRLFLNPLLMTSSSQWSQALFFYLSKSN